VHAQREHTQRTVRELFPKDNFML